MAARDDTRAFVYDDGGRAAAGYKGDAGDCATRAVAIATGISYVEVYKALAKLAGQTVRNGTPPNATKRYLADLGWTWTPTMEIGSGCQVHLRADELPSGRLIVRCSKHWVAVIDSVIHDTHDPSRGGTRCVYGYWSVVHPSSAVTRSSASTAAARRGNKK
jgi:hypothetical protein